MRFVSTIALIALAAVCSCRDAGAPQTGSEWTMTDGKNPVVVIETSKGTITAELWADKAPITVKNFMGYVQDKFFDGLIFHRVIPNFMLQGGGFTPDMDQKQTKAQIKNEACADVPNARGTLAMARTNVVDSASSQFFINLIDNDFLDHKDESDGGFGYCAFGKVTDGMDVVDAIGGVRTGSRSGFQDVPVEAVIIKSIRLAEE
jgi:cyclophilin family peptidyl-prolyl cis-trans isomerase